MTDWKRESFRPGAPGNYDELKQPGAEQQSGKGKTEGESGDAGMGGAPKPVYGDDLYAAIVRGQAEAAEKDRRADIVARRDDGFSLLALAAASAAARSDAPLEPTSDGLLSRVSDQTRAEAHAERERGRGSFQSLKAEQATIPGPSQPQSFARGSWSDARETISPPDPGRDGRAAVDALVVDAAPTRVAATALTEDTKPTWAAAARQVNQRLIETVSDQTRAEAKASWQRQVQERGLKRDLGLGM